MLHFSPALPFLFLALLSTVAHGADAPRRIASLSLCSDELLVHLAEPGRIATLTWLAADTGFSPVADRVTGIPLNHGQAEEIVSADPDLILSTAFSATGAVRLLETLGHEVNVLGVPRNVDESLAQIRHVADLLGETRRGDELVADMRRSMTNALPRLQAGGEKSALFLSPNGLSYGSFTLRDDFLRSVGWLNAAATLGLSGPGKLALEDLLAADVDVVIFNTPHRHDDWLADALPQHPALQHWLEQKQVVVLPDAWFQCAGPAMVQAWESLAQQMAGAESTR